MAERERILFRGVPMVEGWPEKIIAAQRVVSYAFAGRAIPRVRYDSERDEWNTEKVPCHDCRVLQGEFHVPGCDVEECPECHRQIITCDCDFDVPEGFDF